jgi:hypothetical protein
VSDAVGNAQLLKRPDMDTVMRALQERGSGVILETEVQG